MRRLLVPLAFFASACSEDTLSQTRDASSPTDSGAPLEDAGFPDSGVAVDSGPSCDPLAPGNDPLRPAALTGVLAIFDFDFWDEIGSQRDRVRNIGINFLTGTLWIQPDTEAVFYRSIPADTCIVTDVLLPAMNAGPRRNIGTELILADENGFSLRLAREVEADGPSYWPTTQMQILQLFDRDVFTFDKRWTWSTPGDPAANIRPFSTTVEPVEDFEVTPAFTSTGAPAVIDPAAFTVRWTAPSTVAGDFAIVLSRAINMTGDGRYVICRPRDDGEFTVPQAAIVDFGPTPGLAFGITVMRAQAGAFCNEGVQAGAALHVLIYTAAGVVN